MKKDAIERFQQRQLLRQQRQSLPKTKKLQLIGKSLSVPPADIPIDEARIAALTAFEKPGSIPENSAEEIHALLNELGEQFDAERLDLMLGKLSHDVLHSVAGPFGVGKVLAAWDKEGGNVTTVHNAGQRIYAQAEQQYNRDDYTGSGSHYSANRDRFYSGQISEDFGVTDRYTNQEYHYYDHNRKRKTLDCDHKKSCSEYHQEGGFIQSSETRAKFASDQDNFALTSTPLNCSKSDKDILDWASEPASQDPTKTNAEFFHLDQTEIEKVHHEGQTTADKYAPTKKEWGQYYGKELVKTGACEGVKMGAQQAIGLVTVEFFSCTFTEIRDVCQQGRQNESLLQEISHRLKRIATKLTAKWKDVAANFGGGFLSGFLSNLVTVAVNMFITTGKRAVRMIREGLFSLLKALKMLLFPPKNLTRTQAAHESLKLLSSGGIVVAGVLLEEAVEKLIAGIPFLTPIASAVTAVLVGGLTATAMALACYLLDQADLFGVIRRDKEAFVHQQLNQKLDEHLDSCELLLNKMVLL